LAQRGRERPLFPGLIHGAPASARFRRQKRALLRSAATVFAAQGLDRASMSQIARESGVSKALLYHYYPGKDALIFDIIHSHLTDLEQAILSADCPQDPPAERLHRMVAAVLDCYRDADDAHKVQLNAASALAEDQRARIAEIERRIVRQFALVIGLVNPGLALNKARLMPVTMSLFGMMNWVYMWFREDGPISRADYARLATDLFLKGVTVA
jgi:AcrR family transcriptional regulator